MDLFTIENLFTLAMLTLLQAVLGLDNLLYIALESKRAEPSQQKKVRQIGIGGAVILRIVLLFLLIRIIGYFQESLFQIDNFVISGDFNIHSLIVLFGGVFIIYTATSEIIHMLNLDLSDVEDRKPKSANSIIFSIILMNLVFSFDSILAAIALTDVFVLMVIAIVIGGLIMIFMADRVSEFLKKNRMFEVLGLFILFIVGIMLLSEGGHLAHMHLFENAITPMSKTTFYFVIFVLILIDIVQSKYQKNLKKLK
jgi:predicted tellurium resistance membrane protein TerC|tara:strand:+ start:492 stop:1253 length:762 start_codon:yes stop_codon:yes gene_type:complete